MRCRPVGWGSAMGFELHCGLAVSAEWKWFYICKDSHTIDCNLAMLGSGHTRSGEMICEPCWSCALKRVVWISVKMATLWAVTAQLVLVLSEGILSNICHCSQLTRRNSTLWPCIVFCHFLRSAMLLCARIVLYFCVGVLYACVHWTF